MCYGNPGLKQSYEQLPDPDEFVPLQAFVKEMKDKTKAIKGEK